MYFVLILFPNYECYLQLAIWEGFRSIKSLFILILLSHFIRIRANTGNYLNKTVFRIIITECQFGFPYNAALCQPNSKTKRLITGQRIFCCNYHSVCTRTRNMMYSLFCFYLLFCLFWWEKTLFLMFKNLSLVLMA